MTCSCGSQYFKTEVQKDIMGNKYSYEVCSECEKPTGRRAEAEYVDQDPGDQAVS